MCLWLIRSALLTFSLPLLLAGFGHWKMFGQARKMLGQSRDYMMIGGPHSIKRSLGKKINQSKIRKRTFILCMKRMTCVDRQFEQLATIDRPGVQIWNEPIHYFSFPSIPLFAFSFVLFCLGGSFLTESDYRIIRIKDEATLPVFMASHLF